MMRASSLMRDDDPAAIGLLEELAAQGDAIDGFNDTSRVCYRYFDSYETRAIYAKRCLDDAKGRIVNPLADEVISWRTILLRKSLQRQSREPTRRSGMHNAV